MIWMGSLMGSDVKEKAKRKNGRPKKGGEVQKKFLMVAAVKHDGKAKEIAKTLGISRQAVCKHLKKPEIKSLVEDSRALALKKAKISRARAYKKIAEGMEAMAISSYEGNVYISKKVPDYKERREHTKIALQLLGDLDSKENSQPPVVINMPVITVDGRPLKFDIGQND